MAAITQLTKDLWRVDVVNVDVVNVDVVDVDVVDVDIVDIDRLSSGFPARVPESYGNDKRRMDGGGDTPNRPPSAVLFNALGRSPGL
jgi:hypothetical protein